MKARILNCPFAIALGVMGMRVHAQEIVNLEPGKLIVFRQPVEAPATLLVGEQLCSRHS